MVDMRLCDKLEDLCLRIDTEHLGYLESDERRGEQRKRLESYMKEYLYLTPHDRKFIFPQTAQVLRRSVTTRDDFSGTRAAMAWAALSKYADNLIMQPWRKEFRVIKLYCGFYKHEIEGGLVGAEQMFEAMGYRHEGNSTMVLHGILDPDGVTSMSKDAILAELECIILQKIWDAMSPHRTTWTEVLDFRENHTGSPDQAVRALTYRVKTRLYLEQVNNQRLNCYAGFYDGYPTHNMAMSQPLPPMQQYPRYAQIVSPQQAMPSTYQSHYNHPPHVLKPQDLYPSNGYHSQPRYPAHHSHHNGYSHHTPYYNIPSVVPTAQLIELETSPVHAPHHSHPHPYSYPVPESVRTAEFPSTKAKDDGAGSWESWDIVYKTLESNGYRKDYTRDHPNATSPADDTQLSDRLRGMNLARSSTPPRRSEARARTEGDGAARNRMSRNSTELEDVVPKHRLSKPTQETEVDAATHRRSKQYDGSDEKLNRDLIEKREEDVSNVRRMTEIESRTSNSSKLLSESEFISRVTQKEEDTRDSPQRVSFSTLEETSSTQQERSPERPKFVLLDVSPSFLRDVSPVVELPPEEKWECVTCTFLNAVRLNACEMCGKSRVRGEIKPQPCGGQECPNCTLVNEPGKNFCAACSKSLKNSPTYI